MSLAVWWRKWPVLTWIGKTAASRTTKGLTLKALLRAAAWYTAPIAAASSALMFFPSSSLHWKKYYRSRYSQSNMLNQNTSQWQSRIIVQIVEQKLWNGRLFKWQQHISGQHLLPNSFEQHFLNPGDTRGATNQNHLLNFLLWKDLKKTKLIYNSKTIYSTSLLIIL